MGNPDGSTGGFPSGSDSLAGLGKLWGTVKPWPPLVGLASTQAITLSSVLSMNLKMRVLIFNNLPDLTPHP
jgi:hypothetical protein